MNQIEYTTAVFTSLAVNKADRLAHGAALRNAMHEAIKRGEKPKGYRPDWIQASALAVVAVLSGQAKVFDERFMDDRCSVSDLMDVLATAMGLLRRTGK